MTQSYWRERAKPIITAVLVETRGQPEKAIRKALRAAYPFGPYEHHPVKIWRDEIKRQRGLKKPLGMRTNTGQPAAVVEDPRQAKMFQEGQ